mgnify:CR=1 FL=1
MNNNQQYISEIKYELDQLKIICRNFGCDHLISDIDYLEEHLYLYNVHELEDIAYNKYIKIRKEILLFSDFGKQIKSPNIKIDQYTNYDYERSLSPYNLEKKTNQFNGKNVRTVVFRSGMSAIDIVLKTLVRNFKLSNMKMLDCSFYFETRELIHNLYNRYLNIERITSYRELYKVLDTTVYSIVFLESVDINRPNERINLDSLIQGLNKSNSPLIIIIDTTANLLQFDIEELMSQMNRDVIIFEIKSGIKLGQLGLELANIGIVNLSTNSKSVDMKSIYHTLVAFRSITGCSILPYEEKLLNNDIFYSETNQIYVSRINEICTEFYMAIKGNDSFDVFGGIFSVFLIIKIKNATKADYSEFLEELDKSLKIKKLRIIHGTSFGFRHPRIEIIERALDDICIRLSLGHYKGPLYEALKQFFVEWRK